MDHVRAFPFLLLPHAWSSRNRMRRRHRGDGTRALVFGGIGATVCVALFWAASWLTFQLGAYEELGDYLLRLGLSWVFLTFLSFLAFSGLVTSLSTFFLSDDLRLLLAAPVASHRVFYARFARTVVQSSWMVIIFLAPVLLGVGYARCVPMTFYLHALLAVTPFVVIPVAIGCASTLLLVNVFPARRARDILMLMGLLFAGALVVLLRVVRPERLLNVESLPDVADFMTTLQSPVTPLLPSFWAGEAVFASLAGGRDLLHVAALWTTALAAVIALRLAHQRWHFSGFSRSQEAPKARFAHLQAIDRSIHRLPMSAMRRQLLVKDVKVLLRDVSQWSQLLLLLALVAIYLYNFQVLDLQRVPYMTRFVKNVYAFVNLGMAGLVMATVCARFVFPAVSLEGAAFWIVRTAPVSLRDFLWSKFWTGFVPVLILTEVLTILANEFLGIDPIMKAAAAGAVFFMSLALVGLATGLGARYPRFGASPTEVAGSYGGVAFMIQAVLYILVMIALIGWPTSMYVWARARRLSVPTAMQLQFAISLIAAATISLAIWIISMRSGVQALEEMDREQAA